MRFPVSLREFVSTLEVAGESPRCFVNRSYGELIVLSSLPSLALASDDERPSAFPQPDAADLERDPAWSDLSESLERGFRDLTQRFCRTLPDGAARAGLQERVRLRQNFDAFLEGVYRYKVASDWFRFHKSALEQLALHLLEENNIPYTNDLT